MWNVGLQTLICSNFCLGRMPSLPTSSQTVVYGSYILTIIGLSAAYVGNLTATLAIHKRIWPFKTIREFAFSNYNLYITGGTIVEESLKVQVHLGN